MSARRAAFARGKRKEQQFGSNSFPFAEFMHRAAAGATPQPAGEDEAEPASSSSSSSSSAPPPPASDTLPAVTASVISTWFWDLHPTEKRDVLDVTSDELATELSRTLKCDLSPAQRQSVDVVLQDRAYVTSVRRAFVDAMHKEALIEPAAIAPCTSVPLSMLHANTLQLHPVSRALLHVMARHLQRANGAKQAVVRVTAMAVFYLVYISQITAFIRYPLVLTCLPAMYIATAQTAGPVSAPDPLPLVRTCQRTVVDGVMWLATDKDTLDAYCIWLLLTSWSTHQSPVYFALLCCAASVPIVVSGACQLLKWEQSGALLLFQKILSFVVWLYTLYLSWYSYGTFLFTLLFFFPSLTTIIATSAAFASAAVLASLIYLQSFLYSFSARPFLYSGLYALACLSTAYYYLLQPHTTLLILSLAAATLLCPPLLGGAVAMALSFVGQLVAEHGVLRLMVLCGELGVLLVLAGVVLVLDLVLRRGMGWLEKRGWSVGVAGTWWAVLLRWCMESNAVKLLREWLHRKAEDAAAGEPPPQ